MSDLFMEGTRINRLSGFLQGDMLYSFRRSNSTIVAALLLMLILVSVGMAAWIAPPDPYDLSQLRLANSQFPPAWMEGGERKFFLGTDDQGRDLLSATLYGLRTSLAVGILSVTLA